MRKPVVYSIGHSVMEQLGFAEVSPGLTASVEKQRGDSDAAVLLDQSGPPATVTVGSAPPLWVST